VLFAPRPASADRVDDHVREAMREQRIVGLSLAVVKDGRVVKEAGYGLANAELLVPATASTVYKLASVTKQFLAAGVVLLVQDGKVRLDERVGAYLPDAPPSWDPITVRHLLTHTAGLVREAPGWSPYETYTNHDVVRLAYPAPLEAAPGERYSYSNVGYFALGSIIERVSGRPWSEFLQERIFAPLDMRSTRLARREDVVPGRAAGYDWDGDRLINDEVLLSVRTSGGLLGTVQDLARWAVALDGDQLFSPTSRGEMWTPVRLARGQLKDYGFGWDLRPYRGHSTTGHGGSLGGFRTHIVRFPEERLTVAVLANTSTADPALLARGVAARYLPRLSLEGRGEAADPDPELTERLRHAVADFASVVPDSPRLTAAFARDLAEHPQGWSEVRKGLRDTTALRLVLSEDVAGKGVQRKDVPVARVLHYRAVGAREPFLAVYVTAEGQVAFLETLRE
jgi:D-alanyl-D-alanine carboxypeptidase